MIKSHVERVEIACGQEIVARHPRCYERGTVIYDPLHYLTLLEKKPGALEQAAPLKDWKLDPVFAELCARLREIPAVVNTASGS